MKYTRAYFRPYLPAAALTVALLFGQAMCELALLGYLSDIINKWILTRNTYIIRSTGLIMITVAAGSKVCAITSALFASRIAAKSSRDMRSALFRQVTAFSAAETEQFSTASLITRSTNDIMTVQMSTVMILRITCFAPIMGIGELINALKTTTQLTWVLGGYTWNDTHNNAVPFYTCDTEIQKNADKACLTCLSRNGFQGCWSYVLSIPKSSKKTDLMLRSWI